jgi:flagellar motor switch/type III secretory pathway protein FliN
MSESEANKVVSGRIEPAVGATTEQDFSDYREMENVKLTVLAELDRGMISMDELLKLKVGDILPFSRPVGENIDLFASDILIGNAEILAVNERLAVRISDVNKKLTSSQSKKASLINTKSRSLPRIRRLGSNEF